MFKMPVACSPLVTMKSIPDTEDWGQGAQNHPGFGMNNLKPHYLNLIMHKNLRSEFACGCNILHAMEAGNVPCKSPDVPIVPSESCVQISTSVCLSHKDRSEVWHQYVCLSVCLTKVVLKCDISSPCLWHEPLVLGFPLQKTHGIDFLGECEMGLSKMSIKNNWFAIKINELSHTVCFLNMIIPRDGYDYKLMDPTFGKNISVVLPL